MRPGTPTLSGRVVVRRVAGDHSIPAADNDREERGGVIFDYLTCRAEHALVALIDDGTGEFVDDGNIAGELIQPLVELYSVGLLAKQTRADAPAVYRVTDIARARVRAWRAS